MNQRNIESKIITINAEINEIYGKTEIIQKYKNTFTSPIELKIQFPILPSYNLTQFIITLDNKIIKSKILEKEKGKEKYNDAIASGETAFHGSIFESGEKMEINIGNLLPNKTIEIKTIYLQIINSEDMSYCFSLIQSYPKIVLTHEGGVDINMKGIKCNIYLTTQSNLTRLILLNKRKDINYDISIKSLTFAHIYFNTNDKIDSLSKKKLYSCTPVFDTNKCKFLPYSPLKILFRTENINIPMIYSQYDEEKNESSYLLCYMYSNIQIPSKFQEILKSGNMDALQNDDINNYIDTDKNISYIDKYGIKLLENQKSYPRCYIFIIDQSGSMYGEKINILKQVLFFFLKSLPFGSYFQIIGFGTTYQKYNKIPILYNQKNIEEIIDLISKIDANMGGTEIYNPLWSVFNQDKIPNLPTNTILITDGKVFNSYECINLIKENNDYGIVHCIGIGEDYSKYFIETAAKVGKGFKCFISKYANLFYDAFKILNIYSQKYLQNLNINILNHNEYFDNKIYNSFLNNYYITQNDIISYGFIIPGNIFTLNKNESIKIKINVNNDIKDSKEIDINEILKLNNGNELSKIIIGSLINNVNSLNKKMKQNDIINLSIKYEVLSKYTCFFGSFKNENNIKDEMIKINQFYLNEDNKANVSYHVAKTGKHGHAKNFRIILNEEEVKYNDLLEENFDNSEIYNPNINSEEFELIKKIIEEQNIEEGSWDKKYNFGDKYNKLYDKINDYFKEQNIILNKDLIKKICCTVFIIYMLKQQFYEYINIWAQISLKGMNFLINNKIDYDKITSLISK